MRRDAVIAKLKQTEPALRAFGVEALYLFGSHARDEATAESDVDIFVDPASDRDFGFLSFMDAYEELQNALGRRVEIGYRPAPDCRPTFGRMWSAKRCGFFDGGQSEPARPAFSYSGRN
jgi:predicted nucleotidyltransferase